MSVKVNTQYYVPYFAQYGCSNYGETNSYNSCEPVGGSSSGGTPGGTSSEPQTSTGTGNGGSGTSSGVLTNTGATAWVGLVIGVLMVGTALYLLVKQRKNDRKSRSLAAQVAKNAPPATDVNKQE